MSTRNAILLFAVSVTIVAAVAEALFLSLGNSAGALDLLLCVIYAGSAFAWVKADARAREIEPPAGSALLAALVIPIGVPVYLFRALGLRRGFWASLKALGFLVAVAAAYVAFSYVLTSFRF